MCNVYPLLDIGFRIQPPAIHEIGQVGNPLAIIGYNSFGPIDIQVASKSEFTIIEFLAPLDLVRDHAIEPIRKLKMGMRFAEI